MANEKENQDEAFRNAKFNVENLEGYCYVSREELEGGGLDSFENLDESVPKLSQEEHEVLFGTKLLTKFQEHKIAERVKQGLRLKFAYDKYLSEADKFISSHPEVKNSESLSVVNRELREFIDDLAALALSKSDQI
ncbi:hypothetical protein WJR50_11460 [Catalinimonas sp. 4WD22]|uniref:hypothetical protein n=1 Tax=Catalinimonas locisalis TaxID=3133978 RepID=UPI003101A9AD